MADRGRPCRSATLAALCLALALGACAAVPSEPEGAWIGRQEGVVSSVHRLGRGNAQSLSDDRFGGFAGGIAGTAVGATIGEGAGRTAAILLGFLFGQLGGAAIENAIEGGREAEVFIEVAGEGRLVALRVPAHAAPRPGERVLIDRFEGGDLRLSPG